MIREDNKEIINSLMQQQPKILHTFICFLFFLVVFIHSERAVMYSAESAESLMKLICIFKS